jgi:hypothetical protein
LDAPEGVEALLSIIIPLVPEVSRAVEAVVGALELKVWEPLVTLKDITQPVPVGHEIGVPVMLVPTWLMKM